MRPSRPQAAAALAPPAALVIRRASRRSRLESLRSQVIPCARAAGPFDGSASGSVAARPSWSRAHAGCSRVSAVGVDRGTRDTSLVQGAEYQRPHVHASACGVLGYAARDYIRDDVGCPPLCRAASHASVFVLLLFGVTASRMHLQWRQVAVAMLVFDSQPRSHSISCGYPQSHYGSGVGKSGSWCASGGRDVPPHRPLMECGASRVVCELSLAYLPTSDLKRRVSAMVFVHVLLESGASSMRRRVPLRPAAL